MTTLDAVVTLFPDLAAPELAGWIEQRWVQPESAEGGSWVFHDVDVARVRLIYDLRRAFDTPEETVPLVLSLLDQVYDLRCTLDAVTQALATQSEDVQAEVLAAVRARRAGSPAAVEGQAVKVEVVVESGKLTGSEGQAVKVDVIVEGDTLATVEGQAVRVDVVAGGDKPVAQEGQAVRIDVVVESDKPTAVKPQVS